MHCSMPGLPVPHSLPKFAQVHVHCIGDAVQLSYPLMPSPSALNLFQHQGLFQWVDCSHQMTKILEFQLQHQSFCVFQGNIWLPGICISVKFHSSEPAWKPQSLQIKALCFKKRLQKQSPCVKIPVRIEQVHQVLGESIFPPNTYNRTVYLLSLAHYLLEGAY